MQEVSGTHGTLVLAAFTPADQGFAFEHIDDGLLIAVMMDSGARAWLDLEHAGPQAANAVCGVEAAQRCEPEVCAVAVLRASWGTMVMAEGFASLML
jgi:hypothetical protein